MSDSLHEEARDIDQDEFDTPSTGEQPYGGITMHGRYDEDAVHGMDSFGRCAWCGITAQELASIRREQQLTAAFERLAAALEKLEAKL